MLGIDKGTLILGTIVAVLVVYFFNFIVLGWCIFAVSAIIFIILLYKVFVMEGWIPSVDKLVKNISKAYLKFESKVFKWIDRHF